MTVVADKQDGGMQQGPRARLHERLEFRINPHAVLNAARFSAVARSTRRIQKIRRRGERRASRPSTVTAPHNATQLKLIMFRAVLGSGRGKVYRVSRAIPPGMSGFVAAKDAGGQLSAVARIRVTTRASRRT